MSIRDTRAALKLWGRHTGADKLKFPRCSSHVPKPRGAPAPAPAIVDDIQKAYVALRRDSDEVRHCPYLRQHYQESDKTVAEKARSLKVPRSTYYRRLGDAEWAIHARIG